MSPGLGLLAVGVTALLASAFCGFLARRGEPKGDTTWHVERRAAVATIARVFPWIGLILVAIGLLIVALQAVG
jgi:hypothetical protein